MFRSVKWRYVVYGWLLLAMLGGFMTAKVQAEEECLLDSCSVPPGVCGSLSITRP
jgi:hypothetical protein